MDFCLLHLVLEAIFPVTSIGLGWGYVRLPSKLNLFSHDEAESI